MTLAFYRSTEGEHGEHLLPSEELSQSCEDVPHGARPSAHPLQGDEVSIAIESLFPPPPPPTPKVKDKSNRCMLNWCIGTLVCVRKVRGVCVMVCLRVCVYMNAP